MGQDVGARIQTAHVHASKEAVLGHGVRQRSNYGTRSWEEAFARVGLALPVLPQVDRRPFSRTGVNVWIEGYKI
eukprot:CAMPEP_0194440218 /NCGR_PEP_ID=MMETSP0176-20130528/114729_1 /TAXON_ID=216777 /ORGANISM="Proboscia alata, Strain PI-D3" /LENGTH=73 /DNA_ID=CAMNT_0039264241 /DNA_START=123 /DNA_END=341 /DNA_ORIENTATION=+